MNPPQPPPTGIARFIPGLALIKEFSLALLRTEPVVAVTVNRIRELTGHPWRRV